MPEYTLQARSRSITIAERTLVVGILNVTPDSFSDGGLFFSPSTAVDRALEMVEHGADIIDIGGESSRPFSQPVSAKEELNRVVPVIEQMVSHVCIPISIDTYKSEVAYEALKAGASIVNDISALRGSPDMASLVKETRAGLILMHMQGTPRTMQQKPSYGNVVQEIINFLAERIEFAQQKGINRDQIIIDPGIGFGKTISHNLTLLKNIKDFEQLGRPILIGASRKSFIDVLLHLPVTERLEGSIAAAVTAASRGAQLVRVHDVKETVRALTVADAIVGA